MVERDPFESLNPSLDEGKETDEKPSEDSLSLLMERSSAKLRTSDRTSAIGADFSSNDELLAMLNDFGPRPRARVEAVPAVAKPRDAAPDKPPEKDLATVRTEQVLSQFFKAGEKQGAFNGKVEELKDTLADARKTLSPEQFRAFAKNVADASGGLVKIREKDGVIDEIAIGSGSDKRAVFREAWEKDKAQRFNDKVGDEFFNAGPRGTNWNGNVEGLQDAISQARKSLSPQDFKAFVGKIEQGTGGSFKHTEKPDGTIDSVTFGDRQTVFRESWEKDRSQRWNDTVGDKFFNGGPGKNQWNGDVEGLKDTMLKARESMPPAEFKAFVGKIEQGTGGFFKHTEKPDGTVDSITVGDKTAFRESWSKDRGQRWNDSVGDKFFNGGAQKNQWNGDMKGLQETINQARAQLTPEEFKSFTTKIQEGTGGFFKHTETKDGKVKEVTVGNNARIAENGQLEYVNAKGEVERVRQTDGKEFAYHTGPDGKRVAVEDTRITKYGEDYNVPEYRQAQLKKLTSELATAHSSPARNNDSHVAKDPADPNWQGVRKMTFSDYADFLDDLANRKDLTEKEKAFVLGELVSDLGQSQAYRETKEESSIKKWGRGTGDVEKPGKFVISTEDANPTTLREGNPGWSRHHIVDPNRDGYHGEEVGWAATKEQMYEAVRKHEVEHKSRGNLLRVGSTAAEAAFDLATAGPVSWIMGRNPIDSTAKALETAAEGGLDKGSVAASLHTGEYIWAYRHEPEQMKALAREFRARMVKK